MNRQSAYSLPSNQSKLFPKASGLNASGDRQATSFRLEPVSHRRSRLSAKTAIDQPTVQPASKFTSKLNDRIKRNLFTSAQNTRNTLRLTYQGRATTTIGQVNLATGRVFNVRSSQTSATASITNPRSAGGVRETNPFSLSIASSSGEVAGLREGAFTLNSAIPFNFRGGFLVQYWNLRYSGDQLSGQLTNTGTQFALATNLVNVREPLAPSQITMNRGTTITGRVTNSRVQVRIQGTGVSLFSQQYAFVIDAVLTR